MILVIGIYWASLLFNKSDIRADDKDIIAVIIAVFLLIIITLISGVLIYSSYRIVNVRYDDTLQKVGSIIFIIFIGTIDAFIFRVFNGFRLFEQMGCVFLNVIALLHLMLSFVYRQRQ